MKLLNIDSFKSSILRKFTHQIAWSIIRRPAQHLRQLVKLGTRFSLATSIMIFLSQGSWALNVKELDQLIKDQQVRSVAQLIPLLPSELRQNAIVIFKSLSLQEASCTNPRILLFSSDGRFTLAFNGDPSQRGYEAIEIQEFNSAKRSFEYFERILEQDLQARTNFLSLQIEKEIQKEKAVNFPMIKARGKSTFQDELDLINLNNREISSGPNPAICLACHKSDPRPNWDAYSQWPDTLGDDATNHPNQFVGPFGSFTGKPRDGLKISQCETDFYKSFGLNPRYKSLDVQRLFQTKGQSNNLYTHAVYALNFQRINRMTDEHLQGKKIKGVILSTLWQCESPEAELKTTFYETPEGHMIRGDLLAYELEPKLTQFNFPIDQIYTSLIYGPASQMTTPKFGTEELTRALVERDTSLSGFFELFSSQIPYDSPMISERARPLSRPDLCRALNSIN